MPEEVTLGAVAGRSGKCDMWALLGISPCQAAVAACQAAAQGERCRGSGSCAAPADSDSQAGFWALQGYLLMV